MDAAIPSPPDAVPSLPKAPVRTWPHAVQATLFLIVISAIIGLLTHSLLHGNVQRPLPFSGETLQTRLDLNRATRAELMLLPGVGENMAQRIEAYRILYGPYTSVDELRKVPGIGPLTVERLRPWLVVHASTAKAPPPTEPPPRSLKIELPRNDSKEESLTAPIDVNSASVEELQKLPGIGPKLSQRIVDTREKAIYKNIDELRRVPGIGPKTLAKIKPYVTTGSNVAAAVP